MKVEGLLFAGVAAFFAGIDVVYWYTSHDPTGTTALALAVALVGRHAPRVEVARKS